MRPTGHVIFGASFQVRRKNGALDTVEPWSQANVSIQMEVPNNSGFLLGSTNDVVVEVDGGFAIQSTGEKLTLV